MPQLWDFMSLLPPGPLSIWGPTAQNLCTARPVPFQPVFCGQKEQLVTFLPVWGEHCGGGEWFLFPWRGIARA